MNEIREIHNCAMDLAEQAFLTKLHGNEKQAAILLHQAYEKESEAANLLLDTSSPEPARSVLFRSAASLAYNCNEFIDAEELVSKGLSGNPPNEIAEELKELSYKINFRRNLNSHDESEVFVPEGHSSIKNVVVSGHKRTRRRPNSRLPARVTTRKKNPFKKLGQDKRVNNTGSTSSNRGLKAVKSSPESSKSEPNTAKHKRTMKSVKPNSMRRSLKNSANAFTRIT